MEPEILANRLVTSLRLAGFEFDAIALALAAAAVDSLAAGGFADARLNRGIVLLTEAMRDRAVELRRSYVRARDCPLLTVVPGDKA